MCPRRAGVVVVVAALVLVSGCGQLLGGGTTTETVTPAPVPEPTSTPAPTTTAPTTTPEAARTAGPNGRALAGTAEGRDHWAGISAPESPEVTQPRYLSLRPTCERPPGLVIAIQVGALGNNDPATNEGINTTWQFAAPSNRRAIGPYANFVEVVTGGYGPLLNASAVRYGPLERDGAVASQRVRVTAGNETTTYVWRVAKQTERPHVGCWMTTSVVETPAVGE